MTNPSDSAETAIAHFQSHLDKGWGDLETMIAGIWYRIENDYSELIPTAIPPGYRGTKLRNYLINDCGARRTTKWGATALRGDLKETKTHIVKFYELINQIPNDELRDVLKACGLLYAGKVNAETPEIVFPMVSAMQQTLISALRTSGTVGKVQQGLVYAALILENRVLGANLTVTTKPTHAGDLQSGVKGDVILKDGQKIVASYEVKANHITESLKRQVLETHGTHSYPLFIVATGFTPPLLQDELNSLDNTFAIHLIDFMLTLLGDIQTVSRQGLDTLIHELVEIYNRDFCESVEQDKSIMIQITEEL
jgi:hypothetical protein